MPVLSTKEQLMIQLQQEHAQWEALLDEIGRERMEVPGVIGDWTMKDTIADYLVAPACCPIRGRPAR